ncbi:anthranilate synthase/indole-3-glycerol phosphate synthase/phosphoribosylanthranilate isomerase [Blastomyces parvus]|uniref:Anthranilate synthase/indole-3-glycerol phosphate synthase/phosphoribosylanthranilate isomerase n=1 Tax=Blastomyces parvus TaxID=2060905 RepID=A0A2B7XED3_9EURO|nr:anthranilate synthase/indole-3-glycerol phosphate synthase/phosphoribosylanthranilate isomerase [Blastomyces parvus]
MGKTLRKLHISLAGDFGQISEKIKQWVEANGGDFSKQLEKGATTHLITTKDAIRKRDATVQQARKIKGLKIVKLEWLEDSLLSKNRRPKRENDYLWYQARDTRKSGTSKHKNTTKNIDGVGPDDHHIFTDSEGFPYLVALVRPLEDVKFKEKHTLQLYESDSSPRTYAAFVKYTRVGRAGSAFLAPTGSTWEIAFTAFAKFFKAKCGKKWGEKMDGTEPLPQKDGEGCVLPPSENWFRFEPQKGIQAGTGKSSSSTALAEQGKSKEAES